jgi:endonuclease/exonuclease/phosphatase family metal-dependent hydrolase
MAGALVIASVNLDSLDEAPEAAVPLPERIAVLRPLLERLEADIVCLQEVNSQKLRGRIRHLAALDRLLAGTRYAAYHRICTRSRSGRGPLDVHNLVTLSRFPIAESGQLHNALVPAPSYRRNTAEPRPARAEPVRWDRPLLYAALELGAGRTLWTINLHLRAPIASFVPGQKLPDGGWRAVPPWAEGFLLAAIKQIGQALEARLLIDRLLDADGGTLIAVCGDFNAERIEMPVRLVEAAPEDTGNPALADRRMVLLGEAGPAAPHTVLHAGRPMRPDHMMVSHALAAHHRETDIFNEGLADDTAPAGARSVHAALRARFALD